MNLFDLMAVLTLKTDDYEEGLNSAEKRANDFKDKWNTAATSIGKGLKSIGAGSVLIGGVGAGLYKAADGVTQNLDTIDKMSQKLGLSAKAYQEWDYVLQLSGTSMDSIGMGLKTLTNKFDEAVNGSDTAIETFSRLGLSMEDIQGLSREDLFSKVIFAFQGMEESAERAALANDLLGRSGQELAPLFNTSSEDTQGFIDHLNELGAVISDEAVKDGAAFQDSLTTMKEGFSAASASLMEQLIPAITTFMDKVSEFIANGGLEKIVEILKVLAPVIGAVVVGIGGFKIVTGVIELIKGMSTVFGILNAVMAANPISIVILAIAGLVTAFITLWNKCEGFRNFFINMWDGIKEVFGTVTEWFSEKFTAARDAVVNVWGNIKDTFSNIWSKIKDAFNIKDALNWGKDMLDNFVQGIKSKVEAVKDAVKGVGQKVKDFLGFSEPEEGPLSNFHTYAPDMMNLFIKGIKDNKDRLISAVSDAFDFEEHISKNPVTGASFADNGYSRDGEKVYNYHININQPVSTPDEMMRTIRTESQYGLIAGEAL